VDGVFKEISYGHQVEEGKLKHVGRHDFKATHIQYYNFGTLMHMEPFTHDVYKEAYT
jgi:hypothetical protein